MKKIYLIFFVVIFLFSFFFRLYGITDNHSFWADEAFSAYLAKNVLIHGMTSLFDKSMSSYQPLFVILTALSFKLFGLSEFAARLPVVFINSLGLIAAYLLAKKFSNMIGGLMAAFFYGFSFINLANATQARPYSIIQTLLLFVLYFVSELNTNRKKNGFFHILTFFCAFIASLLHPTGILLFIPYITWLFTFLAKKTKKMPHRKFQLMLAFLFLSSFGLLIILNKNLTAPFNHLLYFKELLLRQYLFIVLPAMIGFLAVFSRDKVFGLGAFITISVYVYVWNFQHYTHNIRYLIPLFGIMFVYNGIFWSLIGEKIFHKKSVIVVLIVTLTILVSGYKIARKPQRFYSPNTDFYGDVQIADYKTIFGMLQDRYPNFKNYVIFNDYAEVQLWYLNGHAPDATFAKPHIYNLKSGEFIVNGLTGKPIYTDLEQFKKAVTKNPRGILIVEDWESILPEDIKQFAKKNMKLEIRVEGLPQAQGDNWPLEVYSWGM